MREDGLYKDKSLGMLTGVTLIRNGNQLGYPWRECISSMATYCDQVLVNVGRSNDGTEDMAQQLSTALGNVYLFQSDWDMSNTGDGCELAKQVNVILPRVRTPWVVYLQADEFLHEREVPIIKEFLGDQKDTTTQVELLRSYFWSSLQKRAPRYELYLGRIFRRASHIVGGDGMHILRLSAGEVTRLHGPMIYHYSRVGAEEQITRRIRNLDQLFHDQEEIEDFEDFTYSELRDVDLLTYSGTHPQLAKEFYDL